MNRSLKVPWRICNVIVVIWGRGSSKLGWTVGWQELGGTRDKRSQHRPKFMCIWGDAPLILKDISIPGGSCRFSGSTKWWIQGIYEREGATSYLDCWRIVEKNYTEYGTSRISVTLDSYPIVTLVPKGRVGISVTGSIPWVSTRTQR